MTQLPNGWSQQHPDCPDEWTSPEGLVIERIDDHLVIGWPEIMDNSCYQMTSRHCSVKLDVLKTWMALYGDPDE